MSAQSTAASPVTYAIDPPHSYVSFAIRHLMIAHFRGGFTGITGSVMFDAQNPANSKVEASIDAASLYTRDGRRDGHLKSPEFLDVEKNPQITFVSRQVAAAGPNHWKVTGDLTMHGVSKEITLDVETAAAESKDPFGVVRNGASATAIIKRADFGLGFNVPLETGGFLLGDDVHVQLDIEMIKKQ